MHFSSSPEIQMAAHYLLGFVTTYYTPAQTSLVNLINVSLDFFSIFFCLFIYLNPASKVLPVACKTDARERVSNFRASVNVTQFSFFFLSLNVFINLAQAAVNTGIKS